MFSRISDRDGSWHELIGQWEAKCEAYGENISDYATASLPLIEDAASSSARVSYGAFAYSENDEYLAACQVNTAFLPGYKGKVLRVRHIVLSPDFDFSSDIVLEDYTNVLVGVFVGAIHLAAKDMPADHLKFHLRSPLERELGEYFTEAMAEDATFTSADIVGSWIYLSKA